MRTSDRRTVLEAAIESATAGADLVGPGARLRGLGWATVDLDRAAHEFERDLGLANGSFVEGPESAALGARCRVASDLFGDVSLALLEPSTEGRVAAFLARFGERFAVNWYASPIEIDDGFAEARPGPFGLERLVIDGPRRGPYRLLVAPRPGTIGR
jgi:hypothetical protein